MSTPFNREKELEEQNEEWLRIWAFSEKIEIEPEFKQAPQPFYTYREGEEEERWQREWRLMEDDERGIER